MRRFISVWFAAALCLLCTACGPSRAAAGNRLILTDENATDGQGWVKFLRAQAEADGSAVQYARSNKYQPTEFSLVRRWENGGWTDWTGND